MSTESSEIYKEIQSRAQKVIDCFWCYKPESFQDSHKVTPDNRVDLLFEDNGRVYFSGPMSTYNIAKNRNIFGIRFRPEYLYSIFNIPLSEFKDETVDIELFYQKANLLKSIREKSDNFSEFISNLEIYFSSFKDDLSSDKRISLFTRLIESGQSLREVSTLLGISEQHLRRLCKKHLGISPKRFERIQRLNNLKNNNVTSLSFADVAVSGGYFDQAHLSNECKELAGQTPMQFFA